MYRFSCFFVAVIVSTGALAEPAFHYEDLRRFDKALQEIAAGVDPVESMEGYVTDASVAFKGFAGRYEVTAESIATQYTKRPIYYGDLPRIEDWLKIREPEIIDALDRLVELAPSGESVPVYLMVADQKAGGTPIPIETEDGIRAVIAIAVDAVALTSETDMSEFPNGAGGRAKRADLPQVVVHETAHVLQVSAQGGIDNYRSIYDPENGNMLAIAIREGCAEYVTFLVSGWHLGDRHIYAGEHEKELWEAFKLVMDEPPFSVPGWFGGSHPDYPDWPSQIGYSLGERICRFHYENATDKREAMKDLFSLYAPDDVKPMATAYEQALED
jgi:hypothetical protein